jgi:hypothetical protein
LIFEPLEPAEKLGFSGAISQVPDITLEENTMADKRTVKAAVKYFKEACPGRYSGKAEHLRKIKNASRPMVEAKRLATWVQHKGLLVDAV